MCCVGVSVGVAMGVCMRRPTGGVVCSLVYNRSAVSRDVPQRAPLRCASSLAFMGLNAGMKVALKVVTSRAHYKREVDVRRRLAKCSEKRVVSLIDSWDDELCLVMPRGERSLHQAISCDRIAGHEWDSVRKIMKDVASAAKELHDHGVVHCDLKVPPARPRILLACDRGACCARRRRRTGTLCRHRLPGACSRGMWCASARTVGC